MMSSPIAGSLASDRTAIERRAVYFVGFRDDRYWHAVKVFGPPDFIHRAWDRYARDDVAPGDLVVFADGPHDQEPRSFTVEAQGARRARAASRASASTNAA